MWTIAILIFVTCGVPSHQRSLSEWDDIESNRNSPTIDSFIDFESELRDSECQCNWRILRHYEAKGCQPAYLDACGCPLKFDCPRANEIEDNDKVCHYKGKEYLPGSSINTTNSCESCRCTRGPQARIICSSIECLNLHKPLEPGCHFLYEEGQCCPTRVICDHYEIPVNNDHQNQSNITCEYEGKNYPIGAKMVSATDPCETCFCTEDWNSGNKSCQQQDCILEKYKAKLMDGCVPIYSDQICCPVEFYCAPDDVFIPEKKRMETTAEEADSMCIFGGKHYEIGKSLSINQESTCIICTCQVPPDFTCIHQACSPNPNDENCYPYFTSDDCCPKYECMYGEERPFNSSDEIVNRELEDEREMSEDPCSEISCTDGRTCMLYEVNCNNASCLPVPTCMKTNASCPTPQCASGCVVTDQDTNRCPTCICGEEIEKRAANMIRCNRPQCFGNSCVMIADEEGCPVCSCSEPCEVPVCQPGCNVISENENGCPKCVCEDETVGCPTPLCAHAGCRIETGSSGCPTCVCDHRHSSESDNRESGSDNRESGSDDRELEMEGSHRDSSITDTHQQVPQQQQQELDNIPRELEIEIPFSDEYDEIAVLSRRSAQSKINTDKEHLRESHKESAVLNENMPEKVSSIAGSRVMKVLKKEKEQEP